MFLLFASSIKSEEEPLSSDSNCSTYPTFPSYIRPLPDSGSAGDIFSHNIGFYFPMLFLSIVLGLVAIIYLFRFTNDLREYDLRFKKLRIMLTLVFLSPVLLHLLLLLLLMVRIYI